MGKAVCSAVCPWRWGCAANGNAPILTCPNLLGEPCSSAVVPSSRMCCSLDSTMCSILHSLGPASLLSSHLINSKTHKQHSGFTSLCLPRHNILFHGPLPPPGPVATHTPWHAVSDQHPLISPDTRVCTTSTEPSLATLYPLPRTSPSLL